MYLTYDEFKNYGGTLDEATFNDLCFEACSTIDWYTFNRLAKDTEIPEAVKRCTYKIINLVYLKSQALSVGQDSSGNTTTNAGVVSQSNDGFSVTFNTLNATEAMEASKTEIVQTIDKYLSFIENEAGKRLLYRGRYPDE